MPDDTAAHILIVEDDDAYRRLIGRMLSAAGYTVTDVPDFAAAMKVIDGPTPIDLLLCDIGMPAGTPHGLSIGHVAGFRRRGLKVLYMTGGHDFTRYAQFAPGTPVLRKPFTPTTLLQAIGAALGSGRS